MSSENFFTCVKFHLKQISCDRKSKTSPVIILNIAIPTGLVVTQTTWDESLMYRHISQYNHIDTFPMDLRAKWF